MDGFLQEEWSGISELAKPLIFMYLIQFISIPLSFVYYIFGKQKQDLYFQIYRLLVLMLSTGIAFYYEYHAGEFLLLYSLLQSVSYLLQLQQSRRFTKEYEYTRRQINVKI